MEHERKQTTKSQNIHKNQGLTETQTRKRLQQCSHNNKEKNKSRHVATNHQWSIPRNKEAQEIKPALPLCVLVQVDQPLMSLKFSL